MNETFLAKEKCFILSMKFENNNFWTTIKELACLKNCASQAFQTIQLFTLDGALTQTRRHLT